MHIDFMNQALFQAEKAESMGEVPVGAVLVKNNEIISTGHNLVITNNDPTAHAEIVAIRKASHLIQNYRIVDSELYITLEPCSMCYSAIINSRISRIIYGAHDTKTGACGTCINLSQSKCFNHKPEIIGGVLESECSEILRNFFRQRRL